MLTDAEKTDVTTLLRISRLWRRRRAATWAGAFYQAYGAMEYRLNNLSPSEESVLRQHLANAPDAFEAAIPAASANNLDTDNRCSLDSHSPIRGQPTASVSSSDWGRRLCGFLGLPPGPALVRSANPPFL